MPKSITLTVGTDTTSGPFPPNYTAGALGYTAVQSNPSGSFAGVVSNANYFGATILAIANDKAVAPSQFMVSLLGAFDVGFLGDITTVDGKVYPSANAVYVQYLVGVNIVTSWIWPLATGGVALVNGTVVFGDTHDTLINLEAESHSSTQINLSWVNNGPTPPANYLLYRGLGSATPTLYQTLAGTVLLYADTGLTANTEYQYYVSAVYADASVSHSVQLAVYTPQSGISQSFNCDCTSPVADGWQVDTLANLRKRVLIAAGYAAQVNNPPPGMVAFVNDKLDNAQKQLYRQHKEFRNRRFFAWQMEPLQRYYGIADDMGGCGTLDVLSIDWVGFEDLNQAWYGLIDGIDPEMYTRAQISTGWPTNYEIRQCIEIFPAPKAAYTLWIKGRFGLAPFVTDTALTTIDSEAIYLLALGNTKAHYRQADAQSVLTQASNYTKYLVAGQHNTRRYVMGAKPRQMLTPPKFLPLGGNQ